MVVRKVWFLAQVHGNHDQGIHKQEQSNEQNQVFEAGDTLHGLLFFGICNIIAVRGGVGGLIQSVCKNQQDRRKNDIEEPKQ